MTGEEYIDEFIVSEIKSLLDNSHYNTAFLLMAHSIEALGGFLDDKPFRAQKQSKIRFRNAMFHLFPAEYSKQNRGDKLYRQFRSHMSHMLIPSAHINLLSGQNEKHLKREGEVVYINAESLFLDILNACDIIKKRLKSGEIRRKNLSVSVN